MHSIRSIRHAISLGIVALAVLAADIANLSRIVTLNNMSIMPLKDGTLTMDTTAKTFRYLDSQEVALQRKSAPAKGAKK